MQPIRLELPTGLSVGTVNVYLFKEPEPVLVDAGIRSDESWEALQLALAEHDLTVLDISRVIVTHAHVDHYGQAGTIASNSDADIWISDLGAPWLFITDAMWARRLRYYEDDFLPSVGLSAQMIAIIADGFRAIGAQSDPIPPGRVHTFSSSGTLQMGGLPWQVLHTPGHASMQTCFYQSETQLLLSADMLLAITPTPIVEAPPEGQEKRVPALPQFMNSLDLIEGLEVEMVYPGHGRPFTNHRRVIQRQRERIAARRAECLDFIKAGVSTGVGLLDKMYAHRPMQFRLAGLWMLIGYLDLLLADGAVSRRKIDGVWHYKSMD